MNRPDPQSARRLARVLGRLLTTAAGTLAGGVTVAALVVAGAVGSDAPPVQNTMVTVDQTASPRVVALAAFSPSAIDAAPAGPVLAQAPQAPQGASLDGVLTNLRNVIMGLAGGWVVACWSVAGLRYMSGEPEQVGRAKEAFRAGAVGFGIVALAPVLMAILKSVVGTG